MPLYTAPNGTQFIREPGSDRLTIIDPHGTGLAEVPARDFLAFLAHLDVRVPEVDRFDEKHWFIRP